MVTETHTPTARAQGSETGRSNIADAYWVAKNSVAYVTGGSEFIKVVGPEALSFLQGMVTNDLEKLPLNAGCEVAYLTAKGSMVGFGRAFKLADGLLLEAQEGERSKILEFLKKYLISEEAELLEVPGYRLLHVVGDHAMTKQHEFLLTCPTLLGFVAVVSDSAPAPSLVRASDDVFEMLRIEGGLPIFGRDMTEKTIPLEANLERAISYTKGCYIGQEVIARGTYRGQMNKRLMGLLLGPAAPAPGAELFGPASPPELQPSERKVGWLTSVTASIRLGQHVALGYVHRDFLEPGTRLHTKEGGVAIVSDLPF
jgi:folate-binding protein YgfZ